MNSYSDVYDFEKLSPLREPRKKPRAGEKVLLLGTLGLVCVGFMSVTLSSSVLGSKYYSVIAYFDSVDGLREGADIEIAGVPVGRVSDISLAPEGQARLEMRISKKVELAEDTIASVAMRGLMGDKVIKLLPDGSPLVIEYGGIL